MDCAARRGGYNKLIAERGYEGPYSTVRRFVRDWRLARSAGGGGGYLELEWAPGTCQVDFRNFHVSIGGRALDLKLLVATLPHSNYRQCVALMSQHSECLCAGLLEIFRRWGRTSAAMVLDNATEASRMVRGEVAESRLFSQFRAHNLSRTAAATLTRETRRARSKAPCDICGATSSSPVPSFGTLAELSAFLAEDCARVNAGVRRRDGRPHGKAYREGPAAMWALLGTEFDAVRWVSARADKRKYMARPAWHGRSCSSGCGHRRWRPSSTAAAGSSSSTGPSARTPTYATLPSLAPAIRARPRTFGESTIRHGMPAWFVEGIDRMDSTGRRRTLRSIGRASESSGFKVACEAALRVVEGGKVPDDATADFLARRIAAGGAEADGADLSVYDGFRAAADGH